MQIKKQLPQFQDKKALLFITGKQSGEFYLADKGKIEKIKEINTPTPEYTDREGFFASRSRRQTQETGAVYEPKDDYIKNKYANKFGQAIQDIMNNSPFDTLYIFCPGYMKGVIQEKIPEPIKSLEKGVFEGNYHNQHPFVALKLIKKKQNKFKNWSVPIKEKARKLLRRDKF